MASIIRTLADANKEAERKAKTSKLILDINEADPITKKNVAILIKRDVFGTGPRNAEELIKAMEVCYGIRLGLTSTDPQFQSPAEWAHAFYFEKYPQLLTVGGRGTGKTLPAAAMIHLKCSHREKYSCVHVAADLSQSAAVQRYLLEWADDEGINSGLDRRNLQSKKAYWQNTKSTWWIATGSMSGVSSNHPAMLSLDELEFADELMVEQSWAVPMERDGHKRMWAGFSTRQRASCLPGHTRIITEDGPKMIRDIVNQKYNGRVKSYNFDSKLWEWKQVINWFNNGKTSEWCHVNLEFPTNGIGGSLTCTKDHQLMRPNGTKTRVEDLSTGDDVCIEDIKINQTQTEILFGTYLGDAYITKDGNVKILHSKKQESYLRWLHAALQNISGDIATDTYDRLNFIVQSSVQFKKIRKEHYRIREKLIPDWIWDKLTPLSIAVWLMDDGTFARTKRQKGAWRIAACHFSPEERERCSAYFESIGIPGYWYQFVKGKKSWSFNFTVKNSEKLNDLIKAYISTDAYLGKGLGWKTWVADAIVYDVSETVLVSTRIKNIVPANNQRSHMYDITVADNHNYLVYSGLLVSNSTMSKLTRMAETGERNIKLMQWSVFETMKPCPSCLCIKGDQVLSEPEKACPLWKWCRGERATKSTGWQSRESVVNLLSTMSEDSFETQMLSLRPPSHGLVLHNFIQDYATNLDLNKGNFLNWVYQPDLPVYAFHDPAENHKSSLLLVQIYQGKIFGFDEIVDESGPTLSKVKEDLENLCRIKGYSIPKAIIVDPRRTDIVKQWREGSPNATGMQRSFNAVVPKMNHGLDEIEAGLELLRSYIRNGLGEVKFYLHPTNCKQHVVAATQNRYKLTKDNELFDTAKQENKFKDEVDCIRYGIIYLHQQVMPTYRSGISF